MKFPWFYHPLSLLCYQSSPVIMVLGLGLNLGSGGIVFSWDFVKPQWVFDCNRSLRIDTGQPIAYSRLVDLLRMKNSNQG